MWQPWKAMGPRAWTIARWWVVGCVFAVVNIVALYLLHDSWGLPLTAATFIAGELGTMARFLINDRWVFGHARPTWTRFVEYHVAVLSSFVIWWGVANLLPLVGVHYLLASIAGQACSVGWSMVTNFLWVWRKRGTVARLAPLNPPVSVAAVESVSRH